METETSARLLRAREVARMLGVDPKRVRELVAAASFGRCGSVVRAGHRFRLEDVEQLIAGERRAP